MQTMKSKIQKVKDIEHLEDIINWMMSDIENYLNRDGDEEYNTTQGIVGIDLLFREWITKNWIDATTSQPKKMHVINK